MMNMIRSGALVGIVFHAACGSSSAPEQSTPICTGQPAQACWINVSEPGFVTAAVPVTDGVSTAKVRHTPGRFCMSGELDPGTTNTEYALLVLPLTDATMPGVPTTITAPFSATARGIAQVQFTISSPPAGGLIVAFMELQRADCLDVPGCLTTAPFTLMQDGSTETMIENAGTVTASLDSFHQPNWGDPALSFDKDLIVGLQFQVQALPGAVVGYDFCVQDVKFLDGSGREVTPP
jgi:hypothetical protein